MRRGEPGQPGVDSRACRGVPRRSYLGRMWRAFGSAIVGPGSPRGARRLGRRSLWAALGSVLLTLLASCSATQFAAEVEGIQVRSQDPRTGERVAADLERFEEQLSQTLPGLRAVPIEVIVPFQGFDEPTTHWPPADPPQPAWERSRPDRVRIRLSSSYRPAYLAQELIRARLGPAWDPLPPFLVQGLAEVLADRWTPGTGDELRYTLLANPQRSTSIELAYRLETGAEDPPRGKTSWVEYVLTERPLESDLEELLSLPSFYAFRSYDPEQRWQLFGKAYVFAEHVWDRLGAGGLLDLCAKAQEAGRQRLEPQVLLASVELLDAERRERLNTKSLLFPTYQALLDGTPLVQLVDELWNANGGRFSNRQRFLENLELVVSIGSGPFFDWRELPAYERWSENWAASRR